MKKGSKLSDLAHADRCPSPNDLTTTSKILCYFMLNAVAEGAYGVRLTSNNVSNNVSRSTELVTHDRPLVKHARVVSAVNAVWVLWMRMLRVCGLCGYYPDPDPHPDPDSDPTPPLHPTHQVW